jgi:hypothetical protein
LGYQYTVKAGPNDPNNPSAGAVRQLAVVIPDAGAPGGAREVKVTAPEVALIVGGDVMTQTAFNAKYGGS